MSLPRRFVFIAPVVIISDLGKMKIDKIPFLLGILAAFAVIFLLRSGIITLLKNSVCGI